MTLKVLSNLNDCMILHTFLMYEILAHKLPALKTVHWMPEVPIQRKESMFMRMWLEVMIAVLRIKLKVFCTYQSTYMY